VVTHSKPGSAINSLMGALTAQMRVPGSPFPA
jgi:hypothetical protein